MDIFDYEITGERQKLPTFKQWCKDNITRKRIPSILEIRTIWLPGNYPNFTFETLRFRFPVYEDSPLFGPFSNRMEELAIQECALAIRVLSVKDGTAKLDQLEAEKATWKPINDKGYRLIMHEKK